MNRIITTPSFQATRLIIGMMSTDCDASRFSVKDFNDVTKMMSKKNIEAAYLFIGNGPKLQYKDMAEVAQKLSFHIDKIQSSHGPGNWLAVYGGDTFVEDSPDLGAVMAFVKKTYQVPLLSVQGWSEVDDFVDYVMLYDEEKDSNGSVVYGGVFDGKLYGGTKIYLGAEFCKILGGVVNVDARGRVGRTEVAYARDIGLRVIDVIPLEPKNDERGQYL